MTKIFNLLKKIMTYLAILLIILVVAGFTYEQISRQIVKYKYPVQGQLVDVGGGRKIQIDCRGTQNSNLPTVVLESGGDNSGSLTWAKIQDEIAKTNQVCSYSRSGSLWSDKDSHALTLENSTKDLHTVLKKINISGPLVLVGFSFGGPLIMHYTSQYPNQVKGLVFVDTSHPDQDAKMNALSKSLGQEPFAIADYQIWATRVLGVLGVFRLFNLGVDNTLPPKQREVLAAFNPQTSADNLTQIGKPQTDAILESGKFRNLGDRPLVVLTATKLPEANLEELKFLNQTKEQFDTFSKKNNELWIELGTDKAKWSTNSKQVIVSDSDHAIQLTKPEIVIKSINEVIQSTKNGTKL
jgi:pimeloyl-ACP methyl ester carboxylesterase